MGCELLAADCVRATLSLGWMSTSYVRQASPAHLEVKMNRLYFCCHVERSRNISQCSEGLLTGTERIDAPSQINPFAMAARESAAHKQTEML